MVQGQQRHLNEKCSKDNGDMEGRSASSAISVSSHVA